MTWPSNETKLGTYLEESKLLLSSQTGHVHPARRLSLAEVVALGLDGTERDTAQTALVSCYCPLSSSAPFLPPMH